MTLGDVDLHWDSAARDRSPGLGEHGDRALVVADDPLAKAEVDHVLEGGDVLVISETLACIGASERTSWAMIVRLAKELLDGGLTRVLVVEMPSAPRAPSRV